MAEVKTLVMTLLSSALVMSSLASITSRALRSVSRLEKLNTMAGSYPRSRIILMILLRSDFPLPACCLLDLFLCFLPPRLPPPPTASPSSGASRAAMALSKLESRKRPRSSTMRKTPDAAAGRMKCCSGVGRYWVYTTWQVWRWRPETQRANSLALGMVADRKT